MKGMKMNMKFADFIPSGAIILDLKTTEKKEVMKEMVEKIKEAFNLNTIKVNKAVEMLMKREEIGSTGIGNGFAVPHCKLDNLKMVVGAFARSSHGISFNAVDGVAVNFIFLILAPSDNPNANLQTLQHISQSIKQPLFGKFLKQAKNVKGISEIFKYADEQIK